MPKKKQKLAAEPPTPKQIDGCFATHHFVQVSEPSAFAGHVNSIGGGLYNTAKPRGVRLFCMQCGQTLELGS